MTQNMQNKSWKWFMVSWQSMTDRQTGRQTDRQTDRQTKFMLRY